MAIRRRFPGWAPWPGTASWPWASIVSASRVTSPTSIASMASIPRPSSTPPPGRAWISGLHRRPLMPIEIRMPRLVDTMTQGAVVAWRKREGELVRAVLDEIGQMAPASIEQPSAALPPVSDGNEVKPAQPAVAITSLARSMARQAGLEVLSLQGSGPEGRVVLADVIKALGPQPKSAGAPAPAAAVAPAQETSHVDAPYVEIPHSRVRQVVAGRLGESKRTIPHFYLETSCRVDALLRVRAEVAGQRDGGLKLSINDF